jgi:hypothetical protein
MIETIITSIVSSVIPAEYMPLVLIILVAWVGIEQWLASTKRVTANSTLQLITNVAKKIINKNTPQAPVDNKPTDVPDRT